MTSQMMAQDSVQMQPMDWTPVNLPTDTPAPTPVSPYSYQPDANGPYATDAFPNPTPYDAEAGGGVRASTAYSPPAAAHVAAAAATTQQQQQQQQSNGAQHQYSQLLSPPLDPVGFTSPMMSPMSPSAAFPDSFPLVWSDITYTVKTKDGDKHILDHVSGIAPMGELTAIMGPSGCGKTSLLNILAGRVEATSGTIGIKKERHRCAVSYVQQEDHLLGFLTVKESVLFAAKLRTTINQRERSKLVKETLAMMGLKGVADVKIGGAVVRGISGGQKRRVSIAEEFVGRRPVMLLDEPTSGLDSSAAYHILKELKALAKAKQLTILLTLHQPSSETFVLVDNLILLAYGRLVYSGPREGATPFFANSGKPVPPLTNPSDHFLLILNADFAEDVANDKNAIFNIADQFKTIAPIVNVDHVYGATFDCSAGKPNILVQTWILTHRCWVNARRNLVMYWIRVAMFLAMAVLMGTVWLNLGTTQESVQNRLNGHFFAIAFLCFMAVAGIPAFLEEALVFKREVQGTVYSPVAYVIATTIISIPFIFLTAVVFTTLCYPLINQSVTTTGHFFTYLGVLFLALFCAEGQTLAIAAWTQIFVVALALTAFMNGFWMVMIGYFVPFKTMPKFWIWGHYASYQKYSFEALVKNDVASFIYSCPRFNGTCQCMLLDDLAPSCQFRGETVIEWLEISKGSIVGWCFVLLGMAFAWRVVFLLGLIFHTSRYN